jgi:hypothetical protein
VPDEPFHLPLIPHSKTGGTCKGSITAEQAGEQVTLKCNECGEVVGTIDAEILKALEQGIADQIVVHKFDELDAPEVFTTISNECHRGECRDCPGSFSMEGETVFCVHDCHRIERIPGTVQ